MAIACAMTAHQLQYHLVLGHMLAETYVALAYKHLTVDHYLFKLLEPVCADVGFINRSWGLEVISGLKGVKNARSSPPPIISKVLPLTTKGIIDAVSKAQGMFAPSDWFVFDPDGYLQSKCGVNQCTDFKFRTTACDIFEALLIWTQEVVDRYWQEDDDLLQAWWSAIWWQQMQSACRDLSPCSLAHVVATLLFNATFNHDRAHDEYFVRNYHRFPMMFRECGGSTKLEDYLPSDSYMTHVQVAAFGLHSGNLESPFSCFREPFGQDLSKELQKFENDITRIIMESSEYNELGTMTH
jgi:hypothetical protein